MTPTTASNAQFPSRTSRRGLRKRFGRRDGARRLRPRRSTPAPCTACSGPNGAGKTTAVRCLTTLTTIDDGTATIDGIDIRRAPRRGARAHRPRRPVPRRRRGRSTARQNLVLFARLSGISQVAGASARRRPVRGVRIDRCRRPRRLADSRAACGDDSTSRPASCSPRRSCSSTSRPRASTRAVAPPCGRRCARSPPPAPPCCSPRSTSTRPTSSPTGSRSWSTGG